MKNLYVATAVYLGGGASLTFAVAASKGEMFALGAEDAALAHPNRQVEDVNVQEIPVDRLTDWLGALGYVVTPKSDTLTLVEAAQDQVDG